MQAVDRGQRGAFKLLWTFDCLEEGDGDGPGTSAYIWMPNGGGGSGACLAHGCWATGMRTGRPDPVEA